MGSIFMEKLLSPLRKNILDKLNGLVQAKRAGNFFVIFLTTFVLLHNYEISMEGYFRHARKRHLDVCDNAGF